MVHTVKLKLTNGYYEISNGADFDVISDDTNHLVYCEDGVWNVVSDPDVRKGGNTRIIIPFNYEIPKIYLQGKDAAIKCDLIKASAFFVDIKDGVAEFSKICSNRIDIGMGKGEMRAKIEEFDGLKIDCGFGTVTADLPASKVGYDITSASGRGDVIINSQKFAGSYRCEGNGPIIELICGMGNININTHNI